MTKDSREHISSLMDGELSHDTSLFVARRLGTDQQLGATWQRYHLVRECLRHPGGQRALTSLSLDLDAVQAAPGRSRPVGMPRWLRPVSGFAIAASVAAVALMVALPAGVETPAGSEARAQPFTSPNPLIAAPVSQPASFNSAHGNVRLNSYLLRHNQAAGTVGRQGFVSFVPIVTAVPVQVVDPAEQAALPPAEEATAGDEQQP